MTKNVKNSERAKDILFAKFALKREGNENPTQDEIRQRADLIRALREGDIKTLKKLSKKRRSKKQVPQTIPVQFDDGDVIMCESAPVIKERRIAEFTERLNNERQGRALRVLDLLTRHRMAAILLEATVAHLCSAVCEAAGISQGWATAAKTFIKYIPYLDQLEELLGIAVENEYALTWSHMLAAMTTKSPELCMQWLKISIEHKYTPLELEHAIMTNADRKIKGQTRKRTYIKAVEEHVEAGENLAAKGTTLIQEGEDIENEDMPLKDFVSALFTIVDTGFFNIQTIH